MIGRALTTVAALAAVATLAGCGSDSLSEAQLRSRALRVCTEASGRLDRIQAPRRPAEAKAFLERGVSALQPELASLGRLSPPPELSGAYERGRTAVRQEVGTLQSTIKGLNAGNDPAVAVKTLQQQLRPLERRARTAWHAVGVPACADS